MGQLLRPFTVLMVATLLAVQAAANTDWGQAGPFPAGQRSVTVTRANGSTFTAQLHYPASAAGANQPFHPQAGPAPAITFGHGFLQTTSRYATTLQHLASHGFIAIASDSEGSLFPSHGNFASDLSRCLTYLEQQHATSGAFLFGKVDVAAFGIAGHSMGGGASLLAAGSDVRIRALAVEAPAETNPSAIAASASIAAPSLLIVGDADTIVPTASHGQPMYNALRSPRQLANIRGGYHCGFIDSTGIGCDSSSLSRADQLLITRRLLTSWFALYLKDDPAAWRTIWGPDAPVDARVTLSADARMALEPRSITDAVPAGAAFSLDLQVRNSDESPVDVEVVIASPSGGVPAWQAAVSPAAPRDIAPGAARTLTVSGIAPSEGSDDWLVTVRNVADGGTVAWSAVRLESRCSADFNRDGGIDGSDVESFFEAWSAALPAADVNLDGGVDGGDLEGFFVVWQAGGC